ncbi:MAG TPA: ParB family protein [Thiohalobacter sp.]|nr:ParB family protein [Thiohalobacter sp.]
MNKKRPTDAEIIDMLKQPNFQRKDDTQPSTDPIKPHPMLVEVEQIKPYDRNPRRVPNSEYERIKNSIRTTGMDQTLTITRRPGDDRYMVAAGGNTRLQAVQELWRETGNERFKQIHCLYLPWSGDTDALVAHLRENDLRGDLTFIDRALAIRALRELLEEETGEQLGPRPLAEQLKVRGYQVGRTLISRANYAVDVLHPAIPTALQAGMGSPQIERIKKLDDAFGQSWASLELGPAETAREVFTEVLSRHDTEQIDLDTLRRDLETELSVSADAEVQYASLLFGAALEGRTLSPPPPPEDPWPATGSRQSAPAASPPAGNVPPAPAAPPAGTASPEDTPGVPESSVSHTPATGTPGEREPAAEADTTHKARTSRHKPGAPREDDEEAPPPLGTYENIEVDDFGFLDLADIRLITDWPPSARPEHLPILRERAWALARYIAIVQWMGGDEIVHRIPAGTGYLMGPLPREAVARAEAQWGREYLTGICHIWWYLAGFAQQFIPGTRAAEYLPDHWRNRPLEEGIQIARDGRSEGVFRKWHMSAESLFGTPQEARADAMWQDIPPAEINYHSATVWHCLVEQEGRQSLMAAVQLGHIYRLIRRACNNGRERWGKSVWDEDPSGVRLPSSSLRR